MKQYYPANLTNNPISTPTTIAIKTQMPQEIGLRIKYVLTRSTTTKTTPSTFLHAIATHSTQIGQPAKEILARKPQESTNHPQTSNASYENQKVQANVSKEQTQCDNPAFEREQTIAPYPLKPAT